MSTTKRADGETVYRVERPLNDDGPLVVSPLGRRAEFEIVDYVDPLVRERLNGLDAGASVRLELSPTAGEGYVATRVAPGTPGPATGPGL